MAEQTDCDALADVLAAAAAGVAFGPERDELLRHATICDKCWNKLAELTQVADEVLLLAPEHEPPAGFEGRLLDRIPAVQPSPPEDVDRKEPTPRWRRAAAYTLAASFAAIAAAGGVWQATSDDRDLAGAYRETLDVANGQYFSASDLQLPAGGSAGTVFFYEGEPSWLSVIVRNAPDGIYDVVISTDESETSVGDCEVTNGTGSVGTTIDEHVHDITEVTLVGEDGVRLRTIH